MKHILLLIPLLALLLPARAQQQPSGISFRGTGETAYSEPAEYGPLYAIKATPSFGEILFTPGGDAWHFSGEYEGAPLLPVPNGDSTRCSFSIPGDGRYTLTASKEGFPTEQRSFTIVHVDFSLATELANELDCEYIDIRLKYSQLPTYGTLDPKEGVEYWVDWGGEERGPFDGLQVSGIDIARKISQPVAGEYEDVDYSVRIRDRFGLHWESSMGTYTSVIPKAEFELKLDNTVSVVGEVHDQMGEAPLTVEFGNESHKADRYEWLLYRDTAEITTPPLHWTDSLIDGQPVDAFEPPLRTYPHPGHYKVILIAENARSGCRDTTDDAYVHVVESLLEVPNVFTPNGDGKNDLFMVRALSIEAFHGVILNRWGRQIFEWNDPAQGWDGRIHGTLANPGTYYYVITARGRERVSPPRYLKKGALMLIR